MILDQLAAASRARGRTGKRNDLIRNHERAGRDPDGGRKDIPL